jgi:two-component system, LytTR family, response regulator
MNNQTYPLNIVLIDDEPDARAVIRLLLKPFPEVKIVAEASNVQQGIATIEKHQPDLIFLDIQLGDETGFDLLAHFPMPHFQVVFCIGFDQYAVQAIKKNALDYLLKPVDPDELEATMQKAFQHKSAKIPPRLAFYTAGEVCFVETKHVCHIESDGAYTTIQVADGRRFVQVRSLREFEEILPSNLFIRTHQSHLINTSFVEKFLPEALILKMKNGNEIPVARRRSAETRFALGIN